MAAELLVARGLLPGCVADLRRRLAPVMMCSMMGYSLLVTPIAGRDCFQLARWRERWRFRELLTFVARRPGSVAAIPASGSFELVPSIADAVAVKPAESPGAPLGRAVGSRPLPPELSEVVGVLPPVPARLLRPPRWVLAVAGGWRHHDRIHV